MVKHTKRAKHTKRRRSDSANTRGMKTGGLVPKLRLGEKTELGRNAGLGSRQGISLVPKVKIG